MRTVLLLDARGDKTLSAGSSLFLPRGDMADLLTGGGVFSFPPQLMSLLPLLGRLWSFLIPPSIAVAMAVK